MQKIQTSELYHKYSNDVLNYALSFLKDIEKAKDAVSEAFLKFIDSQESFRGDCSHKTWLLIITRNYCLNNLSKARKVDIRLDDIQDLEMENEIDNKISIEDAINKLNTEEYEIIYLREYAGHSYREIAEILDTTIDNVKVRLFRVRQKLRKYLR